MKKQQYRLYFLLLLYLLHLWIRKIHFPIPVWLNNYWSDVLCLPIILTLMVLVIRRLQQKPMFLLELKHIVVVCVYISLMFELILPHFFTKFKSDLGDVLAYSLGALVFYRFQRIFC